MSCPVHSMKADSCLSITKRRREEQKASLIIFSSSLLLLKKQNLLQLPVIFLVVFLSSGRCILAVNRVIIACLMVTNFVFCFMFLEPGEEMFGQNILPTGYFD